MGQQQLLLLALGIIIVGLMTLAGIKIYNANYDMSNRQAVIADLGVLASVSKQYYFKSAQIDGLFHDTFIGFDSTKCNGYTSTLDGNYYISGQTDSSVILTGIGTQKGYDDTNFIKIQMTVYPDSEICLTLN